MFKKMNLLKQNKQKESPQVFPYRILRSSLLFAFLWLMIAVTALTLIWLFDYTAESQEGLTLIIASLLCLVLAFHSLEQRGSPYISLYKDRLRVHYSFLRNVTVHYSDLQEINVINEELELRLKNEALVILNLGHLSFNDQSTLLSALHQKTAQDKQISNQEVK